jgi:SAM-dependent methyltransferase
LAALQALSPAASEKIVDIGCGCEDTTLDLSVRVGPTGRVVGVDISVPMLETARRRTPPKSPARPEFRRLDAQSGYLGRELFDAAFSRFGVMFFSDPVAAFENIRASLKPGGRLVFVCWRSLAANPWMNEPLEAARPYLPHAPETDQAAPGPFAFADAARVRSILEAAGYRSVTIQPFDARIGGAGLEQSVKLSF